MVVTLGVAAQISNNANFVTYSFTISSAGVNTKCPYSLLIPDNKPITVRSNPNNLGDVYISNSDSTNSSTRVTLAPGDAIQLYVRNSNVIYASLENSNERIDLIVEQP